MMGGYTEYDRWTQGREGSDEGFWIKDWDMIDTFVYFSHHLITIPPPCWIDSAHRNGVPVLGTFITEWNSGRKLCREIFSSSASALKFASQLGAMARAYKFEGWLVNIENPLESASAVRGVRAWNSSVEFERGVREFERDFFIVSLTHVFISREKYSNTQTQVRHVLEFLRALRTIEKCRVVWYDSVTTSGRVAYQNALTLENKDFFDAAGEIFTNYRWRDARVPMLCAQRAGKDRACGVYMGVDVFGRGTFSGGGYNTTQAIETSLRAGVSSAVFAPGWVYESSASHFENGGETFTKRSNRFWSSIRKVCQSECMRALASHPYLLS